MKRDSRRLAFQAVPCMAVLVLSCVCVSALGATKDASASDLDKLLVKFADIKKGQMEALATNNAISVATELENFFSAASKGDWHTVSNLYAGLKTPSEQLGTPAQPHPRVAGPLWEPVHETYCARRTSQRMGPDMFKAFSVGILSSLPDGSIFLSGTEPGRFAVTALNEAAEHSRVFILSQSALLNPHYMTYARFRCGSQIWVPSTVDHQVAVQRYFMKARSEGKLQMEDGVPTPTFQDLMAINSSLMKLIFDKNKGKHGVYVEEAYPIPWMYPHLQPHGLILKLRKDSIARFTPQMIAEDHAFWQQQVTRLAASQDFKSNGPAQDAFANARATIAGVYEWRAFVMPNEQSLFEAADKAYSQALQLAPHSPDVNMRLARMCMLTWEPERVDRACKILATLSQVHPNVPAIKSAVQEAVRRRDLLVRKKALEDKIRGADGTAQRSEALQLAEIHMAMGNRDVFAQIARDLLESAAGPPAAFLHLARLAATAKKQQSMEQSLDIFLAKAPATMQLRHKAAAELFAGAGNLTRATDLLAKHLENNPDDSHAWHELGVLLHFQKRPTDAMNALQNEIELDGKPALERIRQDRRLATFAGKLDPARTTASGPGQPDQAGDGSVAKWFAGILALAVSTGVVIVVVLTVMRKRNRDASDQSEEHQDQDAES